ncbi:MAG: hypothetical protein HYT07_00525 [Candidatus Levybacteria bacterium]|nr:hypothetical protein [Candidatus Levybacteria bacterium]
MKQNKLIVILVLLLIIVIVWVGGNVYHNLNKSTISELTAQEILPIDPNFDTKALDELKKRKPVNPIFESAIETPTPSPVATSSGNIDLDTEESSQEELP